MQMGAVDGAGGGAARSAHRYRLYEVLPKEPGRPGPQRRRVIHSYDDIGEDELAMLRRLHERRLGPHHVVEVDGAVVRKGGDVSQEDIEASEPLTPPSGSSVYEVNDYAHRVLWDIYERDAEASERLRQQTFELNQRAVDQGKVIDTMLSELHTQRMEMLKQLTGDGLPNLLKNFSMDDLRSLIELGVSGVRAAQTTPNGGRSNNK